MKFASCLLRSPREYNELAKQISLTYFSFFSDEIFPLPVIFWSSNFFVFRLPQGPSPTWESGQVGRSFFWCLLSIGNFLNFKNLKFYFHRFSINKYVWIIYKNCNFSQKAKGLNFGAVSHVWKIRFDGKFKPSFSERIFAACEARLISMEVDVNEQQNCLVSCLLWNTRKINDAEWKFRTDQLS